MSIRRYYILIALVAIAAVLQGTPVFGQGLDLYRRVSDPRAICRLDAADSLPVQIASGVDWPKVIDPADGYYILSSAEGSGVITHLWLMYYKLPADSMLTVKIWIDDSLVVQSYLYELFRNQRGLLRHPFDSVASGGLDCDVQMAYRRNFKVSFYADYTKNICCLFWAVEHRPLADSSLVSSFRLSMDPTFEDAQSVAEKTYRSPASPWHESTPPRHLDVGHRLLQPGETMTLADLSGPGMIQTLHLKADTADAVALRDVWLRMKWDRSPDPSVDVPLADFFGCGAGFRDVNALQSRATRAGDLISYFPMPFAVAARLEVENLSSKAVSIAGDLAVSDESVDRYAEGYFSAQFSRTERARWDIFHHVGSALGRGRFIGVHLAMPDHPLPYYLEGDPYIYVDSDLTNRIHYTGLEDYLNGGWFFLDSVFSLPFAGCTDLYSSAYRFHYLDAYDFERSFDFELQHGVRNDFETGYRSVAFFYRRWTPFWTSRDTLHRLEHWTVGGSGYAPNQAIEAKLDSQTVFATVADAEGAFSWSGQVPATLASGIHRLSVNAYQRPEPVWVLKDPTVRFVHDSIPHVFRFGDSLTVAVSGFKPGERFSIFVDTSEVEYETSHRADSNYGALVNVRIPWVPDGSYRLVAKGDQGTTAKADTPLTITRTLHFEAEDLTPVICEGYTERSYLGYFFDEDWSNQYTRLFYPDDKPGRRMILPFVVSVADTFRITLHATIGTRYGNYDFLLDGVPLCSFAGYTDEPNADPIPSAPIAAGSRYLASGSHLLSCISKPKDPRASEYMLNLDDLLLTPVTRFHSLPQDTANNVVPDGWRRDYAGFLTIYPNPLVGEILRCRLNLDSSVRLGRDEVVIEICDLLGRTVASVLDGQVGMYSFELMQDCSGLANGEYFVRARIITPAGSKTTTIPMVVQHH